MQFQNTTLSAEMLQAIATQNFTEMTEIQAKTCCSKAKTSSENPTRVRAKLPHSAFPLLNKFQRMQNPLFTL